MEAKKQQQMIKDGKQFIYHNSKEYQCQSACYYNPIQHKWRFVIAGTDIDILSGQKIIFLNTEFTVCFTERSENTIIEAWIV